jgi:hypothetical protein
MALIYNKETSFVYHGKRGFFLHFGQKPGKYRRKRAKTPVSFLRFFGLQRTPKKHGAGGFEPQKACS